MTTRINKWTKEYVIQSYWQGWEDVTAEDNHKEARARLREYRDNEPRTSHRLITRRVINPAWKEAQ